jgi:hypothetical protein
MPKAMDFTSMRMHVPPPPRPPGSREWTDLSRSGRVVRTLSTTRSASQPEGSELQKRRGFVSAVVPRPSVRVCVCSSRCAWLRALRAVRSPLRRPTRGLCMSPIALPAVSHQSLFSIYPHPMVFPLSAGLGLCRRHLASCCRFRSR